MNLWSVLLVFLSSSVLMAGELGVGSKKRQRSPQSQSLKHATKICSPEETEEKTEKLSKCVEHFKSKNMSHLYTLNERMDLNFCPTTKQISLELLEGCWNTLSFSPAEMTSGFLAILGVGSHKYKNQILASCNEFPKTPIGISRKLGRDKKLSSIEQIKLSSIRKQQADYRECSDRTIAQENAKKEQARTLSDEITNECKRIHPKGSGRRSPAKVRKQAAAYKACLVSTSKKRNCLNCLESFTQISATSRFLKRMNERFESWAGFSCLNHKTRGEMICELGSAVFATGGLALAATRFAKQWGKQAVEEAARMTRENASTIKSNLQRAKDGADASEIHGIVTEESEAQEDE